MTNTSNFVDLDIPHDVSLGYFLDLCESYNLTFEVLQAIGPAGGNPHIRFHGDWDDLDRFMTEEFGN